MPYANKADRVEAVRRNAEKKKRLGLVRFSFCGYCEPEEKEALLKKLSKAAKPYKRELSDYE